jgi:hypothetical protein
VVETLAIHFS